VIKSYYYLVKPGIIYGNCLTAAAGFFLAAKGNIDWLLFLAMLFGISFIMASGCVFNNYFDRKIDMDMDRTKNRALVTGEIPTTNAIIYGGVLGILGFSILFYLTNPLTTLVALVGFIFYVFIYTPFKRRTVHGTLLGSVAGAVPPVVGYCAVSNNFDLGAILAFAILVLWQMPHFYAIAIYRLKDYSNAKIPVMPVKKGVYFTKINIFLYIIIFILISGLLTLLGYTGNIYLAAMAVVGFAWAWLALDGFRNGIDETKWARRLFMFSQIVLLVFCLATFFNGIIHI